MSAVAKIEQRILKIGAQTLEYCLERKAVKRINLRVRRDGSVHVSAPLRVALATVERFVTDHAEWILAARGRVAARQGSVLTLADGESLPVEGVSHTVWGVNSKKQGCLRQNGELLLLLRDPADAAERRRVFERFVKEEATRVLTARMQALYPLFADHVKGFPALTFRQMKSRWGSCTAAKNHVTLNTNLLFVPPSLCDYVILHELCHFKHQDHSAAFYAHLSRFCPQYAAARQALRAFPIPQF